MIDFLLPKITEGTPDAQMEQMKNYLYQLVGQLNWALSTVEAGQEGIYNDIMLSRSAALSPEEETKKTFSQIKSMIIKSADIIESYSEEITKKIAGEYVAISDFGTYMENTELNLDITPKNIKQLYTDIQEIADTAEQAYDAIVEAQGWITTGLLDYEENGSPIYGMEVGQKTNVDGEESFERYARFTSDGIYFYLPGISNPVAWMSGSKLFITNAEITVSLKTGSYFVDLTDGMAFKYIGG